MWDDSKQEVDKKVNEVGKIFGLTSTQAYIVCAIIVVALLKFVGVI